MKKIVSAAAIAALVAGAASAEMKATLNHRTRPTAFAYSKDKSGDTSKETTTWFDLDGYADSTDTLQFAFSQENFGATLSMNVTAGNAKVTTTSTGTIPGDDLDDLLGTDNKEDYGISVSSSSTKNVNGNFLTLNTYNGWLKFGDLTLRGGSWKDGYADGNYRVKKDVDAGNAEGVDFERYKLGSMFKSNYATFVDDMANLSGGSSRFAAFAEYPVKIDDSMSLNLLVGALQNESYDKIVDGDKTTYWNSSLVSRVQFNMKDTFNSELIFKKPATDVSVVAVYFQPKMVEGLDATIGAAFAIDQTKSLTKADGTSADTVTDWNIDLRLRYQVTKELSITSFNNITGTTLDKGKKLGSSIANVAGSSYTSWVTGKEVKLAMWNNLSGRYVVNDLATVTLNVGLINALGKAKDDKNDYGVEWRVTPGVQLYAAKNASLWTGLTLTGSNYETKFGSTSTKLENFGFQIPMILRVKL